jgi:hypothetical protein
MMFVAGSVLDLFHGWHLDTSFRIVLYLMQGGYLAMSIWFAFEKRRDWLRKNGKKVNPTIFEVIASWWNAWRSLRKESAAQRQQRNRSFKNKL